MKNKKYLLVFTFLLLIISITSVSATEMFYANSKNYNEDLLYEEFSKIGDFDINQYSNFFCNRSGDNYVCYSFSNEVLNSLENFSSPLYKINLKNDNCYYYHLKLGIYSSNNDFFEKRECSYNNYYIEYSTREAYSTIDFPFFTEEENSKITKIDFSKYLTSEPVEDPKDDTDILSKSSNLLSIMINHSKNIINILLSNQIFIMLIGIILSYVCFLVIYRFIRK